MTVTLDKLSLIMKAISVNLLSGVHKFVLKKISRDLFLQNQFHFSPVWRFVCFFKLFYWIRYFSFLLTGLLVLIKYYWFSLEIKAKLLKIENTTVQQFYQCVPEHPLLHVHVLGNTYIACYTNLKKCTPIYFVN